MGRLETTPRLLHIDRGGSGKEDGGLRGVVQVILVIDFSGGGRGVFGRGGKQVVVLLVRSDDLFRVIGVLAEEGRLASQDGDDRQDATVIGACGACEHFQRDRFLTADIAEGECHVTLAQVFWDGGATVLRRRTRGARI